jgi:hypothetical protein
MDLGPPWMWGLELNKRQENPNKGLELLKGWLDNLKINIWPLLKQNDFGEVRVVC